MPGSPADERFTVPLYSVTEAALHIDVPVSTFRSWTHGPGRRGRGQQTIIGEPIVTTLPRDAGVSVPFVGLAEAHALAAIRRSGVPLQRIRPALQRLHDELGIEHVLASQSLYTDGAEVLYDFAEARGRPPRPAVPVISLWCATTSESSTRSFDDYLRRIEFASDSWAQCIHLPKYRTADVVVDPRRSFGLPIFARGGVRLETILAAFKAGADIDDLTDEFSVPRNDLLSVLRVHRPGCSKPPVMASPSSE